MPLVAYPFLIKYTYVNLEKSSINVMKYLLPPLVNTPFNSHTSEYTSSSIIEFLFDLEKKFFCHLCLNTSATNMKNQ